MTWTSPPSPPPDKVDEFGGPQTYEAQAHSPLQLLVNLVGQIRTLSVS